jgi:hypothetical protein
MFLDSKQKPNVSLLDFSCFCIANPHPHPNPNPVMLKILAMKYGLKILTGHCMQLRPMDARHYQNKGPTQGRSKVTNPSLHVTSLFFLIFHHDDSVTENKPSPSYDAFLHQSSAHFQNPVFVADGRFSI